MLFDFKFEGNLADNPELRFTPSGKAVCNLRVAHNTRRFDKAKNEWADGPTVWINVSCWEKLAERVAEGLRRGDTVLVEGRNDLTARAYMSKEDEKPAASLQVTAANVHLSFRFRPAVSQAPLPQHSSASGFTNDEPPF
ncbi:single-stranded DNA-binding protein [Longispora sp. NPDC051575]|uniref:single-stranded DNA-binding protein n=1 Tax=Longispora sp. NPDC051575 TaxID=3154943 RepID=UPI0034425604